MNPTRNSSGIRFDVEDLKKQMNEHVEFVRQTNKKYTIKKAVEKVGLSAGGYFLMIERGIMRKNSISKISKLKTNDVKIVVKTL